MKRLTTGILLSLAFCGVSHADHDLQRFVRRDFEVQRKTLERQYRAERDALLYEFQRQRDLVHTRREDVIHSPHCVDRHERLRALSYELGELARDHGYAQSDLARAYSARRVRWARAREIALREARHGHFVPTRHGPDIGLHPHSCGADCASCGTANYAAGRNVAAIGHHDVASRHYNPVFGWPELVNGLIAQRLHR